MKGFRHLAVALLCLCSVGFVGCSAPPPGGFLEPGAPLPSIELPDLDGELVDLASFQGRPMILNFWATWCGPCRDEIPILKKIARGGVGVSVVGISLDEGGAEKVRDFIQREDVRYPILLGPTSLLHTLGSNAIPFTVILDADHRVVQVYRGLISERMLERDLQRLKSS